MSAAAKQAPPSAHRIACWQMLRHWERQKEALGERWNHALHVAAVVQDARDGRLRPWTNIPRLYAEASYQDLPLGVRHAVLMACGWIAFAWHLRGHADLVGTHAEMAHLLRCGESTWRRALKWLRSKPGFILTSYHYDEHTDPQKQDDPESRGPGGRKQKANSYSAGMWLRCDGPQGTAMHGGTGDRGRSGRVSKENQPTSSEICAGEKTLTRVGDAGAEQRINLRIPAPYGHQASSVRGEREGKGSPAATAPTVELSAPSPQLSPSPTEGVEGGVSPAPSPAVASPGSAMPPRQLALGVAVVGWAVSPHTDGAQPTEPLPHPARNGWPGANALRIQRVAEINAATVAAADSGGDPVKAAFATLFRHLTGGER